jgi:hypothetical protein
MLFDVTAPGRELALRFNQLGSMTGKTADEIISSVGLPNARGSMAFGKTLLQWQATGYHIAILFDANGIFEKITSEYANFPEPTPSLISEEADMRYSKYILIGGGILLAVVMVIRFFWGV